MSHRPRFHLAFPVHDLGGRAPSFYAGVLGCGTGRESDHWIDFDLPRPPNRRPSGARAVRDGPTNAVDGKQVPVRHFGLILDYDGFDQLAERLKAANTSLS
jgi:extradiol dioxygenase family protein